VKNRPALLLCAAALAGAASLRAGQAAPESPDPVLVGAGDIADCNEIEGARATAALLDRIPGTVFTLGDNAYTSGTAEQFRDCYGPTWGRHLERTRPAVGNHDYRTKGAAAYFAYFGAAAGPPDKGYYSYDLGKWHVVVLNSNCGEIGGCRAGSPQEQWLRRDLAQHPALCTVAMWHHPRFSSASEHGDDSATQDLWKALEEAGAELVLSGHDHTYERFAPRDADGRPDPERGIRQFVVGTGGRHEYAWGTIEPTSQAHDNETFGVLKLTLHPDSYDWEFVPVEGGTFTDSGTAKCH
jgi:3',5'-cyclic AMP phosphodiesterase CpdA